MPPNSNVAIFWDYENCPPSGSSSTNKISGIDIVRNIRSIAHLYGSVKLFKAYAELRESSRITNLRSELQSSGVSLIDCPHNGKKNVADMMMIVDMMVFAADYYQPTTLIVITADRDFAYAISTLRLRQHEIVVVAPFSQGNGLTSQASYYHDWDTEVLEKSARPHVHARTRSLDTTQRVLPPVLEVQPPSPPSPPSRRIPVFEPPRAVSPPPPPLPQRAGGLGGNPSPLLPRVAKPSPPSQITSEPSAQTTPTPTPALSANARPFYPTLESYGFITTPRRSLSSSQGSSISSVNSPLSEEGLSLVTTQSSSQKTLEGDDAPEEGKELPRPLSEVVSDERHLLIEDAASSSSVFYTPVSQNSSLGRDGDTAPSAPKSVITDGQSNNQEQCVQGTPQKAKTWADVYRTQSIASITSVQDTTLNSTTATITPKVTSQASEVKPNQVPSTSTTQISVTNFKSGSTSTTPTIPPPFHRLVSTLQSQRAQGVLSPRSSVIAQSMPTKDIDMRAIGVDKFSQFIALAQQQGILTISGPKGEERLALKPPFVGASIPNPAPPAPVDKPSALKAQHPRFKYLIEILQEYHAKGFARVERSVIAEQLMARHGPRVFVQLGFLNWRSFGEEAKGLGIVVYDVQPSGGHTWIRLNPDYMSP